MAKVRNLIKKTLEQKGLTQTWLAEKLDVDFVTVNRYANNHKQPPLEVLGDIAKLLKTKIGDLIDE